MSAKDVSRLLENLRNIPVVGTLYSRALDGTRDYWRRNYGAERAFTEIYDQNSWQGEESVSGTGSSIAQTQVLIDTLPHLLCKYQIKRLLDVPCGDFHWMQHVDLHGVEYIGGDIVKDLVADVRCRYTRPGVRFEEVNLLAGKLPEADLIFVRDCLVHFSYDNIRAALTNICESEAKYLLTTTFPDHTLNYDIETGDWRPLNLQIAPFSLPPPELMINEQCTELDGRFADKSMAMWRVEDIRRAIAG